MNKGANKPKANNPSVIITGVGASRAAGIAIMQMAMYPSTKLANGIFFIEHFLDGVDVRRIARIRRVDPFDLVQRC